MRARTRPLKFCGSLGLFALSLRAAAAGDCVHRPERFELRSDTVYWSASVRPGSECLQGLRGSTMLLEDVKLIEPARAGIVTIAGPSFRYQAPSTPINDSFRIAVAGENRRQRGTSVIVVEVTVK
jgi:hypothetical protein